MEFVCGVVFVLLVITVVGHGIWLMLAALFRSMAGEEAKPAPPIDRPSRNESDYCPACQTYYRGDERRCISCGLARHGKRARELEEIQLAVQLIRSLIRHKELEDEQAATVLKALAQRRHFLIYPDQEAPAATTASTPEPAPVEALRTTPVPPRPEPQWAAELPDVLEVVPVEEAPPLIAPVEPEPVAPRRTLGEMLSGFMEERNILWGELVGGLLIVGCSIALVFSLWNNLQALPFFPFLIFSALTAALFAAGHYTLHHWKLTSTSRGLLVIVLLLLPLNLLILADPSARGPDIGSTPINALVDVAALGAMLFIARGAIQSLFSPGLFAIRLDPRWLLGIVVIGPPAVQLLAPSLFTTPLELPPPTGWFGLLYAGLGLFLVPTSLGIGTMFRSPSLKSPQVLFLFSFLALGGFALLATAGFLLGRFGSMAEGLPNLALPMSLVGIPALALGFGVRSLLDPKEPTTLRAAGTGVALGGVAFLTAGVLLAWPMPLALLATLAVFGLALAGSAGLSRQTWLYYLAVPAVAVASLLGVQLMRGQLGLSATSAEVMHALLAAEGSLVLVTLAGLLTLAAALVSSERFADDAVAIARGAFSVGVLGLFFATAHGPDYPRLAGLVHGLGTLTAGAATLRWPRHWLAQCAAFVLIPGILWTLHGFYPHQTERWAATLAVVALLLQVAAWERRHVLSRAAHQVALLAGALVPVFAGMAGLAPPPWVTGGSLAVLAAAIFLRWQFTGQAGWFLAFQGTLTIATLVLTTTLAYSLGHPADWTWLQWCVLALGMMALVAEASRPVAPAWPWDACSPTFDRAALLLTIVGHAFLGLFGVFLALQTEWGQDLLPTGHAFLAARAGWSGWVLPLLLALPLALRLRQSGERINVQDHLALVVQCFLVALGLPLVYTAWHGSDLAGASAARWSLGVFFLTGSALMWGKDTLARLIHPWGFVLPATWKLDYGSLATVAFVVVWLTGVLTFLGFSGAALPGPLPGSPFARMGATLSSLGPIVLVVVGLIGTAVRERSSGYALAAGLLLPISVMGGTALGMVQAGQHIGETAAARIGLLGCDAAALAALTWLAGRQWIGTGRLLLLQSWMGLLGLSALVVPIAFELVGSSGNPSSPAFDILGGMEGWLALALATWAAAWHAQITRRARRLHVAGVVGIVGGLLAVAATARWDTPTAWVSYYTLAAVWGGGAGLFTLVGSLLSLRGWPTRALHPLHLFQRWMVVLALLTIGLALIGYDLPMVLWFVPPGLVLAASALVGGMALWFNRGGYAHVSGVVFTLAALLAWTTTHPALTLATECVIILGLAVSAAFWWAVDMPWQQAGQSRFRTGRPGYAPLATGVALFLLSLCSLAIVRDTFHGNTNVTSLRFAWAAALGVGVALGAACQAGRLRLGLPGSYILGLVMVGLLLASLGGSVTELWWRATLLLAGYAFLVGLVVKLWQQFHPVARTTRLTLPYPVLPDRETRWLVPAQAILSFLVLFLAMVEAGSSETLIIRLAGVLSVVLLVAPTWWIASTLVEPLKEQLRLAALGLAVLGVVTLALALPDPTLAGLALRRHVLILTGLSASAIAGLELFRTWRPGQRLALGVGGIASAWVILVLGLLVGHYDPASQRAELEGVYVALSAVATVGLIGQCLRLALRGDPLGLPEAKRGRYVYLAELLLALLLAHVRLCVPELFQGNLGRYWMFVVLAAGFAWVMLAEWASRRGHAVLAEPLMRTGVLLPSLPILAFWARPPQALLEFVNDHAPGLRPFLAYLELLPWNLEIHASVWLLTSALYGVVALTRRSSTWGILSALAANFGFWALLAYGGIHFTLHPQAWIIPLGLILLVTEYLHRGQMPPATAEALRYLGITMIYVASMADLLVTGLGNSLALPMLLALLCVLGVFAGIFFRVRAFLFLGLGFLFLDVLAMIWHAAIDRSHTWVLWGFGIVLGVAILALFAVFEKRRQDVLALVEKLRGWH
ncbi:MAG: hypothetical protein U0840_14755 [Gemmataceae bacterium]